MKQTITSGIGVTKVSAPWLLKQTSTCKKCNYRFYIEVPKNTEKVKGLRDIANKFER